MSFSARFVAKATIKVENAIWRVEKRWESSTFSGGYSAFISDKMASVTPVIT